MRITNLETWLVSPTGVYVRIDTDEGISGYGEATVLYFPQAVEAMIKDLAGYLIGQDPMRIEYLWQSMFRDLFMRGGPVHGAAISGVDMALYDLKGKALNLPVYELLGGLVRDRVRLYSNVAAATAKQIAEDARDLVRHGTTMIRFRGFHSMDNQHLFDLETGVNEQIEFLAALREAVGDDIGLIMECHGRYDLNWATIAAKRAEPYHPFFMEDPIRQENPHTMRLLRQATGIPIATGERGHSKWDFNQWFTDQSINYARPDICHCGGITEMKKIAAIAEVNGISLVPHNTQGPLAMAACMHTAFTIDNIAVVEAPFSNHAGRDPKLLQHPFVERWPEFDQGYAYPPKGPGLGVTVDEDALNHAREKFKPPMQPRLRAIDGSVRDW